MAQEKATAPVKPRVVEHPGLTDDHTVAVVAPEGRTVKVRRQTNKIIGEDHDGNAQRGWVDGPVVGVTSNLVGFTLGNNERLIIEQ